MPLDSSSRHIVFRSLLTARDPARRRELVRSFVQDQLRCLLEQLDQDLEPEAIAKALSDVASVLRLPPAGDLVTAPPIDPSDASSPRLGPALALLAIALVFFGCACGSDHVVLEDRWAPLRRVQTDARTPVGAYRTVGELVLTGSVCDFLAHDAVAREALLLHERSHALRQQEEGVALYLRDFGASRSFRWNEESNGWALQLTYCVQHGEPVDEALVASHLANDYDGMIGPDAALAWVQGVVSAARDESSHLATALAVALR